MRRPLTIILTLLVSLAAIARPEGYELLPDSSNFVTASVLVIEPGRDFYSNLGHAAIRMECPVHDLDYCFSFGTHDDTESILRFFAGRAEGSIIAIPTREYLDAYRKEGRGATQLTLNLTLHEKQRLWQLLDNDMIGMHERKFNFVQNNCTSIVLLMIEKAMIEGDKAEFIWPEMICEADNATALRHVTRNTPWMQFVCLTLSGTEGEQTWHNRNRMSPELLPTLLQASSIRHGDTTRPMLTDERKQLLPATDTPTTSGLTPTVAFAIVLAVVLFVTFAEHRYGWRKTAKTLDVTLFAAQAVVGIALLYITLAAGLFGVHWNWMLIPLNPLPALFGLTALIWRGWRRLYLVYGVVLVLFLFVGLTLSVFILPHALLTAALAVRCLNKGTLTKRNDKKQ